MPVKKKSTLIYIIIIVVLTVLFGSFVGLFVWKYLQIQGYVKRLKTLEGCPTPSAPAGITAVQAPSPALTITIGWTAVTGASSYTVVVVPSAGGPATITTSTGIVSNVTVSATGQYDVWVHSKVGCTDGTSIAKSNPLLGTTATVSVPMLSPPSSVVSVTIS